MWVWGCGCECVVQADLFQLTPDFTSVNFLSCSPGFWGHVWCHIGLHAQIRWRNTCSSTSLITNYKTFSWYDTTACLITYKPSDKLNVVSVILNGVFWLVFILVCVKEKNKSMCVPAFGPLCVVWMGVETIWLILRSDGEVEKRE